MLPRVSSKKIPHPSLIVIVLLLAAALACNISVSRARFDNARLYKASDGEDSTRSFKPNDTVYLITTIKNVDDELPLRVEWIHLVEEKSDTDDAADEDREPTIIPTEIAREERAVRNGPLTLELVPPTEGWSRGSYQAHLYLAGDHKATLPFSIK